MVPKPLELGLRLGASESALVPEPKHAVPIHPEVSVLVERFKAKLAANPLLRPQTCIIEPALAEEKPSTIAYNGDVFNDEGVLKVVAREEDADKLNARLVEYTITNGQLTNRQELPIDGEDPYLFTAQEVVNGRVEFHTYLIYVKTTLDPLNPSQVTEFHTEVARYDPVTRRVDTPIIKGPSGEKGFRLVPTGDGEWDIYTRVRKAHDHHDGTEEVDSQILVTHVKHLADFTEDMWSTGAEVMAANGLTWIGLGPVDQNSMLAHAGMHVYRETGESQVAYKEPLRPYITTRIGIEGNEFSEPECVVTAEIFREDYKRQAGKELEAKNAMLADVNYPMEVLFVPVKGQPGRYHELLICGVNDRYIGAALLAEAVELDKRHMMDVFYSRRIIVQEVAEQAFPALFAHGSRRSA